MKLYIQLRRFIPASYQCWNRRYVRGAGTYSGSTRCPVAKMFRMYSLGSPQVSTGYGQLHKKHSPFVSWTGVRIISDDQPANHRVRRQNADDQRVERHPLHHPLGPVREDAAT